MARPGLRGSFAWRTAAGLMLALSISWAGVSGGGEYPAKAVDVVVPYAPGGGNDLFGRIAAQYLAKKWGKPINVVNKAGGSGVVGVMALLAAPPDGYTVMTLGPGNVGMLAVQSDTPYKLDDLLPLAMMAGNAQAFTVPFDSPWKTLKEAVEAIKRDPDKVKYGVGGAASPPVFAVAKLFQSAGIDVKRPGRVIFNGGAPTLAATAGGQVAFACQSTTEAFALIRAGKLRALAVSSPERAKMLPDVPTGKEAGYPAFDTVSWYGIAAHGKAPEAVAKKWADGLKDAARDPEVIKKLDDISAFVIYKDSAEFKAFLQKEYALNLSVAKETGLRK